MAVICDDVVECYNNQDERCEGVKDNTVPYILTSIAGMFYVALKAYWWFYLRHHDLDDEDDFQMEELASNQDQEVNIFMTMKCVGNIKLFFVRMRSEGQRQKRILKSKDLFESCDSYLYYLS